MSYDEGKLFWKVDLGRGFKGKEAGTNHKGYLRVCIKGKRYLVHRIIFFMHFGYMPEIVDHIDHDKRNNRPENLRDVSAYINSLHRQRRDSGVSFERNRSKYRAEVAGKFLGYFEIKEDAINEATIYRATILDNELRRYNRFRE